METKTSTEQGQQVNPGLLKIRLDYWKHYYANPKNPLNNNPLMVALIQAYGEIREIQEVGETFGSENSVSRPASINTILKEPTKEEMTHGLISLTPERANTIISDINVVAAELLARDHKSTIPSRPTRRKPDRMPSQKGNGLRRGTKTSKYAAEANSLSNLLNTLDLRNPFDAGTLSPLAQLLKTLLKQYRGKLNRKIALDILKDIDTAISDEYDLHHLAYPWKEE